MNSYFRSRYGEDWREAFYSNFEDMNREFDEWLKNKEESGNDYYDGYD